MSSFKEREEASTQRLVDNLNHHVLAKVEAKKKSHKPLARHMPTIFGYMFSISFFIFIAFILNIPQHFYWQKVPGALFEKQNYTAEVYIKVYPHATGNTYYWLKGVIDRGNTCDNNFELYDNSSPCTLAYNLLGFKWPNGGVAYFDSCDIDFTVIRSFGIGCDTDSSNSKTYFVQLTNEVVK